jgi:hypothetical protein
MGLGGETGCLSDPCMKDRLKAKLKRHEHRTQWTFSVFHCYWVTHSAVNKHNKAIPVLTGSTSLPVVHPAMWQICYQMKSHHITNGFITKTCLTCSAVNWCFWCGLVDIRAHRPILTLFTLPVFSLIHMNHTPCPRFLFLLKPYWFIWWKMTTCKR